MIFRDESGAIMDDVFRSINLSAYSRLALTFQEEMKRDVNSEYFNDDLYKSYINMHRESSNRRDNIFKTVVILDFIALLAYYGKNINIPVINVSFSEIPGGFLSVVLLSSLSFFFASIAFANEQFYKCIVTQFNIKKARILGIDPDYLNYADIFEDIHLKIFRNNMSIYTKDYYSPHKPYRALFGTINFLIAFVVLIFLSLHLFFSISISVTAYQSTDTGALTLVLASATILINFLSVAIIVIQQVQFRFDFNWTVLDQANRQSFDQIPRVYGSVLASANRQPNIEQVGHIRGARLFYDVDGKPSEMNIHHEINGEPKELNIAYGDFMYLLSILKSVQLDHAIPFPDDPRRPT